MSWKSPWSIVASAVERANEYRKEIETSIDAAMGVAEEPAESTPEPAPAASSRSSAAMPADSEGVGDTTAWSAPVASAGAPECVTDDALNTPKDTPSIAEALSAAASDAVASHTPTQTRLSTSEEEHASGWDDGSVATEIAATVIAAVTEAGAQHDVASAAPVEASTDALHDSTPVVVNDAAANALVAAGHAPLIPADASSSPAAPVATAVATGGEQDTRGTVHAHTAEDAAQQRGAEAAPAGATAVVHSEHIQQELESLRSQLAATTRVLEAREQQLSVASEGTARAMDEILTLQRALASAEARATTAERSLAEEKRRAAAAAKDTTLSKLREQVAQLENDVKERDARITDILAEGEGLSKKVGSLETAQKALRTAVRTAETERDARAAELKDAEAMLSTLKHRVETLEQEADAARRDKSSASDAAHASQSRLASLEEELSRLRGETKALRAALATAQKEVEDGRAMVTKALADAEVAERGQQAAEASLAAARSAEAAATRVVTTFEEQVRDLRNQLNSVRASSAAREDELRRELDDVTMRLQRAQAAAEESGLVAIAAAYGVSLPSSADATGEASPSISDTAASPGKSRDGPTPPGSAKRPGLSIVTTPASAARSSPATTIAETLVAQIANLQTELQTKRDAWTASRAALQARLAAAESALETADADVKRAEAAASDASHAAAALRTELITLRGAKARSDAEVALVTEKLKDAEVKLAQLTFAHDLGQRQLSEMTAVVTDLRSRVEEQSGARAAAAHMSSVLRDQVVGAQEEIVNYKREIAALKREVAALRVAEGALSPGRLQSSYHGATDAAEAFPANNHSAAGAAFLRNALTWDGGGDAGAPAAAPTAAQATIEAMERERMALTSELVSHTTRVAALEGAEAALAEAKAQHAALTSKNELLLEMLGEREEEIEGLRADLDEVRAMYRIQLEALMTKAVALEARPQ